MNYSPLVFIHICAASIGLLSGAPALFSRKGSRLHRAAGNVFFISILSMSATGAYMAAFVKPVMINVVVGVLTFYLVATAWLAIARKEAGTSLFELGLLFIALADGSAALIFGSEAANDATGLKDGMPAAAYFVFGSVALLACALDVGMFIRGGVSGAHRIARHLWRMCFAMLITTISFFVGKQELFPEVIRKTHILNVPVLIVAGLTIFWLCRVLFTKAYKKPRQKAESTVSGRTVEDSQLVVESRQG